MTAANLRIVPRNFHDDATLSVSVASATGCTPQNTQDTIRSRFWKSTDGADQYMLGTFDDGFDRTVSYFGFFRHRCHGGNVRLQLYSDAAWITQVYDSGTLPVINVTPTDGADWGIDPYGSGAIDPFILDAPYWIYFEATTCLSYKITFSDNVATFGAAYWQVCRFFLGNYIEATFNPAVGALVGFADPITTRIARRPGACARAARRAGGRCNSILIGSTRRNAPGSSTCSIIAGRARISSSRCFQRRRRGASATTTLTPFFRA